MKDKALVKIKKNSLIAKKIKEFGIDVKVGDSVIADRGEVYRVKAIKRKGILLEEYGYRYSNDDEPCWHEYSIIEFREFNSRYLRLEKPIEEVEKETLDAIKDVDSLDPDKDNQGLSDSHEIAPTMSKEVLISMRNVLDSRRKKFEIMERILHGKRNALSCYVNEMEKRISKIQKIIDVIELYLGIKEKIIEIKDGEQAPIDTPITFRQQILYMDEEVGDPTDEGLDFRKISEFDKWVIKSENLNKMLPEIKGVVIIKPRRHDRDYGSWFVNTVYSIENKQTYILIRNGERVYRIYSEHLQVERRLFPIRKEFEDAIKKTDYFSSFDEEKLKERIFDYRKNALMMQGLIDRTNVFFPHYPDLNIFKPNTYKNGQIQFIHDDEAALPPEKMYWKDWHKQINSTIQRGSRIYLEKERWNRDDLKYYLPYQFKHQEGPRGGIYKITKVLIDDKEKRIQFVFNNKDTVWPGWGKWSEDKHERKKGITFTCNPDEYFILNYDRISLDDTEYYINSRIDRENYLSMIPTLWAIKKERLKEIEWEKHFVKLVSARTKKSQEEVWKAINWWKYKNIWKRPIREDDSKALRMIERKVKNPKLWSKKLDKLV